LTGFGQCLDEIVPIHIVKEDVIPLIATAHYVVKASGELNPDGTWHNRSLAFAPAQGNTCHRLFNGPTTPRRPRRDPDD
jgi:hypothetical protein